MTTSESNAGKSYRSELVGVLGDPIDENPTKIPLEAGFGELDLDWRYLNLRVTADELEDALKALKVLNFKGVNLTIPHKVAVMEHLDHITDDARLPHLPGLRHAGLSGSHRA